MTHLVRMTSPREHRVAPRDNTHEIFSVGDGADHPQPLLLVRPRQREVQVCRRNIQNAQVLASLAPAVRPLVNVDADPVPALAPHECERL